MINKRLKNFIFSNLKIFVAILFVYVFIDFVIFGMFILPNKGRPFEVYATEVEIASMYKVILDKVSHEKNKVCPNSENWELFLKDWNSRFREGKSQDRLLDFWGQKFRFEVMQGEKSGARISSNGSDGEKDTDDDISLDFHIEGCF